MNYDAYVENLKSTLLGQLEKTAYAFLVSNIPFLSFAPLQYLTKKILNKLLSHLINEGEIGAYLLYTDFRVSRQGQEYQKASEAYQKALKTGDKNEIQKAEAILKLSFKNLVSFHS